jgi:hypothetical protein
MCAICGEYEVGTFEGHAEYCSDLCADMAYDATCDGWNGYEDIMVDMYDDDPNPYAGTYSEE